MDIQGWPWGRCRARCTWGSSLDFCHLRLAGCGILPRPWLIHKEGRFVPGPGSSQAHVFAVSNRLREEQRCSPDPSLSYR